MIVEICRLKHRGARSAEVCILILTAYCLNVLSINAVESALRSSFATSSTTSCLCDSFTSMIKLSAIATTTCLDSDTNLQASWIDNLSSCGNCVLDPVLFRFCFALAARQSCFLWLRNQCYAMHAGSLWKSGLAFDLMSLMGSVSASWEVLWSRNSSSS